MNADHKILVFNDDPFPGQELLVHFVDRLYHDIGAELLLDSLPSLFSHFTGKHVITENLFQSISQFCHISGLYQ